MSLIMLDIDNFKEFNDAFGHQVGDDCLRAVGRATEAGVDDPAHLVARYGGEELAIVLQRSSSTTEILCAERVRQTIEALAIPHPDASHASKVVTVSVDVATAVARSGGSAEMPHVLLTAADQRLIVQKPRDAIASGWRSLLPLMMASHRQSFNHNPISRICGRPLNTDVNF
ncbi:diguanylate cyclase [Polymorphobacter megasporae]|uniref:diguanylate cyclase n=1 Tax=Glacieibacterium megasporae TaxID=2835787 RepID=UPI00210405BA|nr:diguanylate cyclase [Polymorphobacter megasporae]